MLDYVLRRAEPDEKQIQKVKDSLQKKKEELEKKLEKMLDDFGNWQNDEMLLAACDACRDLYDVGIGRHVYRGR